MDKDSQFIKSPQRAVTYLRVSVTDRCNLRCFYCLPVTGLSHIDHAEILTYEEILRVIRVGVEAGVTKVRITGGEPLVRRDVVGLVDRAAKISGIRELCLTTNGTMLDELAESLYRAGLDRLNVSLDSLDPETFRTITRGDFFEKVISGMRRAESVGFSPLKINTVVMAGINDHEIGELARLSMDGPFWVRFIEFMPVMGKVPWTPQRVVTMAEMKKRLEERFGPLSPSPATGMDNGPAVMYSLPGAIGKVGFIGAVSGHFCDTCNRMRLTADGKLKPCLFSNLEVDVKTALRQGCDDAELAALFQYAVSIKPGGRTENPDTNLRPMSSIGG